jgi:hypothetical protein
MLAELNLLKWWDKLMCHLQIVIELFGIGIMLEREAINIELPTLCAD